MPDFEKAVVNSNGPLPYGCFFFDLDGTLADSVSGLTGSVDHAFRAIGKHVPEVSLRPYVGPGIRVIFQNLDASLTDDQLDIMELAFRQDYDSAGVLQTDLFPDVFPVLSGLHAAGAKLFVITNKPKVPTSKLLEKHGLTSLFTSIVSRDSRVPAYANKGEMLRDTATANQAHLTQSIMVGDTEEDAEAAAFASMRFLHAGYGYGSLRNASAPSLATFHDLLQHCAPVAL